MTAQKRVENAQDVPIAVTSIGGAVVDQVHAASLRDLQGSFPGVHIGNFAQVQQSATFSIRGIGVVDADAFAGTTVSIVADGVPQYFSYGALLDLYDIERIEALKGPQGTLFGANTTGGVVNVVTAGPADSFGGKAEVTYGNLGRVDLGIALTIPLRPNLSAKLTAFSTQNDGWIRNVADPGQPIGKRAHALLRGYLKYDAGSPFNATLIAEYSRARDGGSYIVNGASPGDQDVPAGQVPILTPEFSYVAPGVQGMYPSICPADTQQYCKAPDHLVSARSRDMPDVSNMNGYRLTYTMNILDTAIGDVTAITGYRKFDSLDFLDSDGTPLILSHGRRASEGWQFSQEVRTSAKLAEDINLIAGLFYLTDYYEQDAQSRNNFAIKGFVQNFVNKQSNYSLSGFAQGAWQVSEKIELLAGIRYTFEHTRLSARTMPSYDPDGDSDWHGSGSGWDVTIPAANIALPGIGPVVGSKSWRNVGWKLGANYKPTRKVLLYASWSRGFKSGGFAGRLGVPQDIGPYSPEKVDSYEIGAKTEWFDRRLRLNMALFDIDYRDMQLSQSYTFISPTTGQAVVSSTILNASSARISGAELEVATAPAEGLTLGASLSYLNARYSKFFYIEPQLDGDPTTPGRQPYYIDMKGKRLMNAPQWSYSVNAAYETDVGTGKIIVRADYAYSGEKYQTIQLMPRSRVQPTHLLGASLDWQPAEADWTISVWGRNLADKHYLASAFSAPGSITLGNYMRPREFGVTARVHW